MRFLIKILLTSLVIAGTSELAKKSSLIAAILISLPLSSILALCWLYFDTRDTQAVAGLADGIFWAVLPSLLFFVVISLCLKHGLRFELSMLISCSVMAVAYAGYAAIIKMSGISAG